MWRNMQMDLGSRHTLSQRQKVSVVIPAFNAERYVLSAISSVLEQEWPCLEIIVVDDGSTDSTAALVAGLADDRVRLISIKNSGGPARPRNVGLEHSQGEYIFVFDADDKMLPGKIASSVEAFERAPTAGILFT